MRLVAGCEEILKEKKVFVSPDSSVWVSSSPDTGASRSVVMDV
jgi:hypothetical protein